ncbi:MAG TPA: alpha/beta fold hydrolase [Casimicrobiaceae bacterium]|nr:alpha/beta fold hydrolase [Casimicrobiaceae bacterium]
MLSRRLVRRFALALAIAVLAVGGCGELAQKERELTFRVVPGEASWFSGLPQGVREMDIPIAAEDGPAQRIHAWWWPADDAAAPAVLYLHGSRWNLTGQLFRIRQLHEFGFAVLAVDYRGFGKSEGGVPSERSVYEDARAAWREFAALVPDPRRRILYGHSLGGAVAVDLAAWLDRHAGDDEPARGLVVESSFTTLADVARAMSYDWLPVEWILSQKFDSLGKIGEVRMPVLFVHGAADRFIPARFSQALYDAARTRKRLLLVDGATHNNSMRVAPDAYRDALFALFGLHEPDASPAPAPRARGTS